MSNAIGIEFDTILYYNSPHDELKLVRMCQWVMQRYNLTNHNSPYDELWHKIVPKLVYQYFSNFIVIILSFWLVKTPQNNTWDGGKSKILKLRD